MIRRHLFHSLLDSFIKCYSIYKLTLICVTVKLKFVLESNCISILYDCMICMCNLNGNFQLYHFKTKIHFIELLYVINECMYFEACYGHGQAR